ncbi:GNAT family N-acetyltransferase [Paraburkholderia sp. DHOC27]|uniref:GNAT family N-acetyltransferase n=1 Tax=Paraburkholderia sp. DHOC27 TaxID=2303330 RepID=UPI000E3E740E|nr:GNAT family N-acetyltransferase [Paraburkholderia sp. DHOC27]RFU49854.1 GNAT family N-acetyltransferase [Paraburkholderia sp. DHOC27]
MNTELSPVLIRPTTEEDWENLKTIRLAALLDSPTAFGLSYATAATYTDEQWRERASPQTHPQFFLALRQGQAMGLIGGAENVSGEYNLIAMWIRPQDRGMGIASRLVNAIKARAIELGHRRIVLSVSPDNADAVRMYRRQGFTFLPEWEPLASQPGVSVQKMEWRSDR